MPRTIHAILFDLGDTLLDFGPVNLHALFRAGTERAYEYTRQIGGSVPEFRRYLRRHFLAVQWHVMKGRLLRRDFNSRDVMADCARRYLSDLSEERIIELCWKWYEPLREAATVEPGLHEMLAAFREQGLAMGIVSNTFVPGAVLDRHLREEGLIGFFDERIYSCDTGYRKPDRRIFEEACRRLNIRPDETMFVGDSPKADICGGRRMGMVTVLKDRLPRRVGRHMPDHRIHDIVDLAEIVETYRQG